ncbi:MAG: hypothetical protein Q8K75_07905 [Chlamydiales bacterium]|nr:hypothetical protein [Chlamydiales bacterium]
MEDYPSSTLPKYEMFVPSTDISAPQPKLFEDLESVQERVFEAMMIFPYSLDSAAVRGSFVIDFAGLYRELDAVTHRLFRGEEIQNDQSDLDALIDGYQLIGEYSKELEQSLSIEDSEIQATKDGFRYLSEKIEQITLGLNSRPDLTEDCGLKVNQGMVEAIDEEHIQDLKIQTELSYSLQFQDALTAIATIEETLNNSTDTQELEIGAFTKMQKKLDTVRVILANGTVGSDQILRAKFEVAILSTRILGLQTERMTAEDVMSEFVADFLQPYLAGRLDPMNEPERPTLLAQLQGHLMHRGYAIERDKVAVWASLQFVIQGMRHVASQAVSEEYHDAHLRSVAAHKPQQIYRTCLTSTLPSVVKYRELLGPALAREFAPTTFSAESIDDMLDLALTLI